MDAVVQSLTLLDHAHFSIVVFANVRTLLDNAVASMTATMYILR